MGRDHHGHSALDHGVDVRPELAPRQRIDARGRLVQEHHRRLVHDGAGQGQPLLETGRHLAGVAIQIRRQAKRVDHALRDLSPPGARQAVDAREKVEVLPHAQIAVERELLRHVAQLPARRAAGAVEIDSRDLGRTRGGAQQPAHHPEGGRLARAVGAEQAENLPALDPEGDPVDRGEIAELLGQVIGLDHGSDGVPARRLGVAPRPGRVAFGPSAQQVDKGILKARRGRFQHRRVDAEFGDVGGRVLVGDDQPHAAALDHAIHDVRLFERLGQDLSAGLTQILNQKTPPRHAAGQFLGRTVVKDAAFVEQHDRGAAFGFVQIRRAPNDADALIDQLVDHLPQLAPRDRIDAHAGLVEQQQPRRVDQRAGQPELLLHAAGKLARQPVGEGGQAGKGEQTFEDPLSFQPDHAPQIGVQVEVFLDGQIFVQPEPLRHVADRLPDAPHAGGIEAADRHAPRVREHQRRQQPQQRRLAGAVRTDQAGHLRRRSESSRRRWPACRRRRTVS